MTPICAFTSGVSSVRSRRPTVVRSRWPCSMLVNLARLVFSQSCSGLTSVVCLQLAIICCMCFVFFYILYFVIFFFFFFFPPSFFPFLFFLNRTRQVALGDGGHHFRD